MRVCTYFDSGYQSRGESLFSSLSLTERDGRTVLLLDETASAENILDAKSQRVSEYLASHGPIARIISDRNRVEKIFSVGPSFLMSQISSLSPDEWLVYADADLYFLRPLEEYLIHFDKANVIIAPHRHFAWNQKRLAKYGEFNVGLVAFRNNNEGQAALKYWADSCLDWCSDVPTDGRYADQKYLESFFKVANGVVVDKRPGVNVAPWNLGFSKLALDSNEQLTVDGEPVYYFHAQGIRRIKSAWVLGHLPYLSLASMSAKKLIYKPYLGALLKWEEANPTIRSSSSRLSKGAAGLSKLKFITALQFLLGQVMSDAQLRRSFK